MSEKPAGTNIRRKPRLAGGGEDAGKVWKIRVTNGRVWAPVGLQQIKEMLDVAVISEEAEVAPIGSEDWLTLGKHAIWTELRAAAQDWKFDAKEAPDPGPQSSRLEFGGEATPRMREQLDEVRVRKLRRAWRSLLLWRLAQVLRVLREFFVFVAFLALGDLLTAGMDPALGVLKWVVLMGVIALAVGYYALRMLGR